MAGIYGTGTFAPGDHVKVVDLRTGTSYEGHVEEVHGDGYLVVMYDNGTVVRVGRGFVSLVDAHEPTDAEIYGAGAD